MSLLVLGRRCSYLCTRWIERKKIKQKCVFVYVCLLQSAYFGFCERRSIDTGLEGENMDVISIFIAKTDNGAMVEWKLQQGQKHPHYVANTA